MKKNDIALMFTCSLIEFIGRRQKLPRRDVVQSLGRRNVVRIYNYADVLHCEPIERVADEYITLAEIGTSEYDNAGRCKYEVPDYWTIGEVFARLIEDVSQEDVIRTLFEVYQSWISEAISNYNSDFFYQPRDYIRECYLEGEILES